MNQLTVINSSKEDPSDSGLTNLKSCFIFTIENFMELTEEVNSPLFRIKTEWYIKVNPSNIENNVEYISVFLYSNALNNIKAKYSVSIINGLNKLVKTSHSREHEYKFDVGYGFNTFTSKSLINDSDILLRNKHLRLHFLIEVIERKEENAPEFRITNYYQKMINKKEFSDFTFIIDKKKYFVHKIILSTRSQVFDSMFVNDMIEKRSNQCCIPDIECDVFEALLSFIYTGNSPKVQSMATQLIAVAEKYEILDLKDICEDTLLHDLTLENALQTLSIADKYNANKVINKILDFIVINITFICDTLGTELNEFIVKNPRLVTKIFRSISIKSLLINRTPYSNQQNWIYGNI